MKNGLNREGRKQLLLSVELSLCHFTRHEINTEFQLEAPNDGTFELPSGYEPNGLLSESGDLGPKEAVVHETEGASL